MKSTYFKQNSMDISRISQRKPGQDDDKVLIYALNDEFYYFLFYNQFSDFAGITDNDKTKKILFLGI